MPEMQTTFMSFFGVGAAQPRDDAYTAEMVSAAAQGVPRERASADGNRKAGRTAQMAPLLAAVLENPPHSVNAVMP